MKPIFKKDDPGLMKIRWGTAAVKSAQKKLYALYKKYHGKKALPSSIPVTLPHTIFYGPGGTGKTVRAEYAAEMLGCSEKEGTFIRLNAECIDSGDDLAKVLKEKLNWNGYLCSKGHIYHDKSTGCIDENGNQVCKIIDPIRPRGPIIQKVLFIDEIHVLSRDVQEQIGLILLDFRYQYKADTGEVVDLFFPKFTCLAATTKIGDLLTPLQTRFGNQIEIPFYTDEEMIEIVQTMAKQRGWAIEQGAAEILGLCSQGVARMGENLLRGLYEAACYFRTEGNKELKMEEQDYKVLTEKIARRYIRVAGYAPDGLKKTQIKTIEFLINRGKTAKGNWCSVGEQAICDNLGIDKENYKKGIEPRLIHRSLISRSGRGRCVTNKGVNYLKTSINS